MDITEEDLQGLYTWVRFQFAELLLPSGALHATFAETPSMDLPLTRWTKSHSPGPKETFLGTLQTEVSGKWQLLTFPAGALPVPPCIF